LRRACAGTRRRPASASPRRRANDYDQRLLVRRRLRLRDARTSPASGAGRVARSARHRGGQARRGQASGRVMVGPRFRGGQHSVYCTMTRFCPAGPAMLAGPMLSRDRSAAFAKPAARARPRSTRPWLASARAVVPAAGRFLRYEVEDGTIRLRTITPPADRCRAAIKPGATAPQASPFRVDEG
jgi:hypothetical protein